MTTPQEQPVLHSFFDNLYYLSAEELAQAYRQVGQIVSYAIEVVIANHVATKAPMILEGDTLVPGGLAKTRFANLDVGNQVRSIFLVEPDEAMIRQNMVARGRG